MWTSRTCGQVGHVANDPNCPKNKNKDNNGNNGKFKGKCNLCGMKGHKEADCFEKEENTNRRPRGWKSKIEKANVATHNEELLLMAKSDNKKAFNSTVDLLKDPHVFFTQEQHATQHLMILE